MSLLFVYDDFMSAPVWVASPADLKTLPQMMCPVALDVAVGGGGDCCPIWSSLFPARVATPRCWGGATRDNVVCDEVHAAAVLEAVVPPQVVIMESLRDGLAPEDALLTPCPETAMSTQHHVNQAR